MSNAEPFKGLCPLDCEDLTRSSIAPPIPFAPEPSMLHSDGTKNAKLKLRESPSQRNSAEHAKEFAQFSFGTTEDLLKWQKTRACAEQNKPRAAPT